MKETLTFTAGRMLCGKIRDFLKECEFIGLNIRWIESTGWIERKFTIIGDKESIVTIHKAIAKWVRDNNLS